MKHKEKIEQYILDNLNKLSYKQMRTEVKLLGLKGYSKWNIWEMELMLKKYLTEDTEAILELYKRNKSVFDLYKVDALNRLHMTEKEFSQYDLRTSTEHKYIVYWRDIVKYDLEDVFELAKRRKDIIKAKRQQFLDNVLNNEMERMRKICFKYMRRELLTMPISIEENELESGTAGKYEKIKIDKYRYNHKISVDTNVVNRYFYYKYNKYNYAKKKDKKQEIVQIIRHELCHALAEDSFQSWAEIDGCNSDGSPIFLSILEFLGGTTTHLHTDRWKKSEIYHDIKQMDNWKDVEKYLMRLILKYEKVADKFNDVKIGNVTYRNKFLFSGRDKGLVPYSQHQWIYVETSILDRKLKKTIDYLNFYEVGYLITPQKLEQLINKKMYQKDFKYQDVTKKYYYNFKSKELKIKDEFQQHYKDAVANKL